MKVCIFEDEKFDQLFPLTYFRPVFGLKCGHTLLWEKVQASYKSISLALFCREYLGAVVKQQYPEGISVNDVKAVQDDDLLMINGKVLLMGETIPLQGPEEVGMASGSVAYIRINKNTAKQHLTGNYLEAIKVLSQKLPVKNVQLPMIEYPWNLIQYNPKAINADFKVLGKQGIEGNFHPTAVIFGPTDQVFIAKGAEIHPFVVLDTHGGPVIIDEGAVLYPYSRIEGPSCIGKKTLVAGAKIREGTAIGPVCRAGGEIEESILHGYTNKWHDGFFGHGYACEWVNFGALVTNSDLKNNYGNIKIYNKGILTDSKDYKMGSFIGDHTKMGIGLLLNTGTVLGTCCNIYSSCASMPAKFVPSFSWGSGDKLVDYKLEKVVSTSATVMGRRKITQTPEYAELVKRVHLESAWEKNVKVSSAE